MTGYAIMMLIKMHPVWHMCDVMLLDVLQKVALAIYLDCV